ncbi:MAG TPA: hypothetical protein VFW92_10450 [Candidatus Limnocylindrales bacterium]|nr:hypothetical protein [Candidatus Limnocylindrales bacterium]
MMATLTEASFKITGLRWATDPGSDPYLEIDVTTFDADGQLLRNVCVTTRAGAYGPVRTEVAIQHPSAVDTLMTALQTLVGQLLDIPTGRGKAVS